MRRTTPVAESIDWRVLAAAGTFSTARRRVVRVMSYFAHKRGDADDDRRRTRAQSDFFKCKRKHFVHNYSIDRVRGVRVRISD